MIPALFDMVMRIAGMTNVDRRQFLDSIHDTLMKIGEADVRSEHPSLQAAAAYGFENALEDIRQGLYESCLDEEWLGRVADRALQKYRARFQMPGPHSN
jgi:hypothetical protein